MSLPLYSRLNKNIKSSIEYNKGIGSILLDVIKRIYEDEGDIKQIDDDLINITYNELTRGIAKAIPLNIKNKSLWELGASLRANAGIFSVFKSYEQQYLLGKLLLDDKGNPIPFNSFKKRVKPVLDAYNNRYLATEHLTAVRAANTAKNWHDYQKNKKRFPNLKYIESTAAFPRDDHKKLWGIIRPINDPFWKTHYPPNDWNCQCSVQNTDERAKPIRLSKEELDKMVGAEGIVGNAGIDKAIFTNKVSYVKNRTMKEKQFIKKEHKRWKSKLKKN